jgi:hypothetical protein
MIGSAKEQLEGRWLRIVAFSLRYAVLEHRCGRGADRARRRSISKTGGDNAGSSQDESAVNYNFARVHQTLGVTPAMEAGIEDHVWSVEEIVGLLK